VFLADGSTSHTARSIEGGMDALLSSQAPGATFSNEADDALAARALHDPEAFTTLYRAYALDVYRYCHRRLRDREAAEDATSQTFINAYAGLRRLGGKPFRPWLFAIAHNVVVDVHRSRRPLFPLAESDTREDPDPSPEALAIDRERQEAMQLLLGQLPKRDREVVELRLAGLTGREIAQTLSCSREAVRAAQYRAMHRLRELMDMEGNGER
jgi:RNA polymerase sigma-70 factor (ECF subfamily)